QRLHPHLGYVNAVVEVQAEMSGVDGLFQIDIGGRYQTDIDLDRFARADPDNFLLLQCTQQLDLQGHRQVADFVEKQGAAIGLLEPAYAPAGSAGEGAGLMAEQLAFGQVLVDGAAVDRNELALAATLEMNMPGNQFLARSCLAMNEHRRFTGCHPLYEVQQLP